MKRAALSLFFLLVPAIVSYSTPEIEQIDRLRIAEAYRIADKLQDKLWTGWSTAPFGMMFITDDHEFLIRHPKPNAEFTSIGYDSVLKSEVFVRPRKFQKNFLATFPAFGSTPVIVIGKAENTAEKTSTRWVFVVLHEHFHQLQYSRPGYFADVNSLDLHGGDQTGMWQINYPFPYSEAVVATDFRRLTDLLLAAYEAKDKAADEQAVRTYMKARAVFARSIDSKDYRYASFQLWQEGIARYTQYKIAEIAAGELKPSANFKSLPDFVAFDQEAARLHEMTMNEMRNLDLAKWQRVVFYPFGSVEGLLLDRVAPNWREAYFKEKFALERFYPKIAPK